MLEMDNTDLDVVNGPSPDRETHSARGRLIAKDWSIRQIPVQAPPPTSRSDTIHLSKVSLEPSQRAQGDLVHCGEFVLA